MTKNLVVAVCLIVPPSFVFAADVDISDDRVANSLGYSRAAYCGTAPYGNRIVTVWAEEGPIEILGPISMDISDDDGQNWGGDIDVGGSHGDYDDPTVAVSKNNENAIFVAWREDNVDRILFNYTLDDGLTWALGQYHVVVHTGLFSLPSIAITENDQLIIAYRNENNRDIYYKKSNSPYSAWSEPRLLSSGGNATLPCVMRGVGNEVGIAWIERVGDYDQVLFCTLDVSNDTQSTIDIVSDDPSSDYSSPMLACIPAQATTLPLVWYIAFQRGRNQDPQPFDNIYIDRFKYTQGWESDELVTTDARFPGIDVQGSKVARNLFLWNEARLAAGAIGSTHFGVLTAPDTTQGNHFIGNVARTRQAGAISLFGKSAIVDGNVFWRNTAEHGGGGLALQGVDGIIRGNLFAENEADTFDFVGHQHGGGVAVAGSEGLLITNNTFVGNRVTGDLTQQVGAALHDHNWYTLGPEANDISLWNNIFPANHGGAAVGRSTDIGEYEYDLVLSHNLFWGNDRGAYGDDVYAGEGDIHVAAELAGAAKGMMALRASSPAIDAGRPGTWDADSTIADLGFVATNQHASVIAAWDRRYSERPKLQLEAWDGGRITGELRITMRNADGCVVWQHLRSFDHRGPTFLATIPLWEAHVPGRGVVLDVQIEWDGKPLGETLVAVDSLGRVMSLEELKAM